MTPPRDFSTIDGGRLEGEQEIEREPPPPRLRLHYFADATIYDQGGGLIDDLLEPGALSLIYGESGSRKTFLALDMALAIARGTRWRDRDVQQAGVIYVAAEAGRSFSNRVAAYRIAHGLDDAVIPFAYVTEPADLASQPGDVDLLLARIAEAATAFEAPVGLVQIDTLSRALSGADENSSADMGRLITNLDRIRAATDTHVQAIHHTGKDSSRGARGHSLLRAAVDTEIEVVADAVSAFSTATVRKQRDLPTEGNFAFGLDVVELGIGRNGKPIKSCAVAHLGDEARAAAKARKMTDRQRLGLAALTNCLADHGRPAPDGAHYPTGATVAPVDLWREYLLSAGVLDKDAANPREDFRRLKTGLAERGAIAEWSGLVWTCNPSRTASE